MDNYMEPTLIIKYAVDIIVKEKITEIPLLSLLKKVFNRRNTFFNYKKPTDDDWLYGMTVLIDEKFDIIFKNGYHMVCNNIHVKNNIIKPTNEIKDLNKRLCSYIMYNKLYPSSIVFNDTVRKLWIKETKVEKYKKFLFCSYSYTIMFLILILCITAVKSDNTFADKCCYDHNDILCVDVVLYAHCDMNKNISNTNIDDINALIAKIY